MRSRPAESARRARARRRGHPVRPAAGRRAAGAHGHRRPRRAAPDPLRAHGRRDAADHARGHARPTTGRSIASASSCASAWTRATSLTVRTAGGHRLQRHLRSLAGVGEDQRAHQSALLVEPAGRRGVHDARRRWMARSSATGRPATTSTRKYGSLDRTPLVAGDPRRPAVSARAASAPTSSSDFWNYCHTDENSDRVGELAFGTNLGLREMIGILLQDEKVPGVHLAFGDPYGSQTHADWKSRTHVDVLTRDCDVWIDDRAGDRRRAVSAGAVRSGEPSLTRSDSEVLRSSATDEGANESRTRFCRFRERARFVDPWSGLCEPDVDFTIARHTPGSSPSSTASRGRPSRAPVVDVMADALARRAPPRTRSV